MDWRAMLELVEGRRPFAEGAAGSLALHLLVAAALVWPLAWQAETPLEPPAREVITVDLVKAPPAARKPKAARTPHPGKAARPSPARPRQAAPAQAGLALPEETVSLDSPGPYRDYLLGIKRKIEQGWELAAGTRGGTLTLVFSVEPSGHLSAVHLLASSGDAGLDRSALWAVRHAGPFAPMPPEMKLSLLHIRASFCYQGASHAGL